MLSRQMVMTTGSELADLRGPGFYDANFIVELCVTPK